MHGLSHQYTVFKNRFISVPVTMLPKFTWLDKRISLPAVAELRQSFDEASAIHSAAVSTTFITSMQPIEVGAVMTSALPHMPDLNEILGRGLLPRCVHFCQ